VKRLFRHDRPGPHDHAAPVLVAVAYVAVMAVVMIPARPVAGNLPPAALPAGE
jgi:hypothetical protein